MLHQFTNNHLPIIEESAVESKRFGFSIGRLLIPFDSQISDMDIATMCSQAAFDLVIVRANSTRNSLAESLLSLTSHRSLHADSLLYFGQPLSPPALELSPNSAVSSMGVLRESEHHSFLGLIRETFASYTNHYSSNSLLPKPLALEGYVEWASSLIDSSEGHVFVARNNQEELVSFIAVQSSGQTAEIILNGTSPAAQGLGIYPTLLNYVRSELFNLGFTELVTSTQSSNSNVIKVWITSGFNYLAAINTFHVMRH
jgi:ribosomal protein S18 acetylase RimI-like enzyme